METKDKRVKREIANSNERRRMQSINAGFQKLKRLLPVNDGEKLSKAAILQHAAEFIQQIERDKLILHEQNTLLKGTLIEIKAGTASLDSIDLDSIPNIPLNTHIAIKTSTSRYRSAVANTSSDENSDDDCSKEAHSNNNNNNNNNTTSSSSSSNNNNNTNKNNNNNNGSNTTNNTRETINKSGNSKEINNSSSSSNRIISSSSSNNNDNQNFHELAQLPIASVTEIISDRVTSPNGLVSTGVAKAAIALPLEVPYTSETAIIHHDLHPPASKMVKLEPIIPTATTINTRNNTTTTNNTTIDPQDPPPKGQNLETICKAIMQIEGDRVFTNENIKHETT